MLKKFILCASLSALFFGLSAEFSYAMQRARDEGREVAIMNDPIVLLPEIEERIVESLVHSTLRGFICSNVGNQSLSSQRLKFVEILGLVCKSWNMHVKTLVISPKASCNMTDTDIEKYPNLLFLNLSNSLKITDEGIRKLENLIHLNLGKNEIITDEGIKNLTNITNLNLNNNRKITDEGIKSSKKLISLELAWNHTITDAGIKNLTNLINLDLYINHLISDQGISNLRNLNRLDASYNRGLITNTGIKKLPNLRFLELYCCDNVSDEAIKNLTNLIRLNIGQRNPNAHFTDEGTSKLINLTYLNMTNNLSIGNKGLISLTNLKDLDISQRQHNFTYKLTNDGIKGLTKLWNLNLNGNQNITDEGIKPLTNLRSLSLWGNVSPINNGYVFTSPKITDNGLKGLINLRSLQLLYNEIITDEGIESLTNLQSLTINSNDKITWSAIVKLPQLMNLEKYREEFMKKGWTKSYTSFQAGFSAIGGLEQARCFLKALIRISVLFKDFTKETNFLEGYKERIQFNQANDKLADALKTLDAEVNQTNQHKNFTNMTLNEEAIQNIENWRKLSHDYYMEGENDADILSKPQHYFKALESLVMFFQNIPVGIQNFDIDNYKNIIASLRTSLENLKQKISTIGGFTRD